MIDVRGLRVLIDSNPDNESRTNEEVLSWLNTASVKITKETLVTEGILMAKLGASYADGILIKLESFASSNTVLSRALKLLSPSQGGVDIGGRYAIEMIETLVTGAVLTRKEGDDLKALGEYVVSPLESENINRVRMVNVINARKL